MPRAFDTCTKPEKPIAPMPRAFDACIKPEKPVGEERQHGSDNAPEQPLLCNIFARVCSNLDSKMNTEKKQSWQWDGKRVESCSSAS